MRSLLFVPGDDERKLAKALTSGADALILDLEDSVAEARKASARGLVAEFLAAESQRAGTHPQLWVRINPLETTHWLDDLSHVIGGEPAAWPKGIVLPKPRGGHDVSRLAVAIDHRVEVAALAGVAISILAIATELPSSLLSMESYTGASRRLTALSWGAEDLSAEVGARATRDHEGRLTSPFRLARDLTLFAAAAAEVDAIDTVFVDFRNDTGLRRECEDAARDGFSGKLAIHPGQIPVINDVFTPSSAAVAHAQAVIAAFRDAGTGVAALDGQMIDRPHVRRAERILARARTSFAKLPSSSQDT
ncbi:MAG: HpcH/HpaI aldolase/citrate lyase family protein [Hyphomicrobiaceae bacterium]